jgi:hypothetical protein
VEEVVRLTEGRSNDGYYTPMQAAHILRLTPTRVRQLLQSGELEGERDEAGHWLIPARLVHERLERLRRESFLEAVGYDPSSGREMRELVEVLRSQVEMLRAELDEAHAANRENRRIIAALTQRIPELEAPRSRQDRPKRPAAPRIGVTSPRPPETLKRAQRIGLGTPPSSRCVGDSFARGGGGCSVAELQAAWALDHSSVGGGTTLRRARKKKPRRSILGGKG